MATPNNVQNSASNARDKVQDAASSVMDTAKQAGQSVMDSARDMASSASSGVSQAAGYVSDKASQATGYVGERAGDAKSAVGTGIQTVGDYIEHGGKYLQDQDFQGIAGDIATLIRRNPIPALLIGLGVGFLLARATVSSWR